MDCHKSDICDHRLKKCDHKLLDGHNYQEFNGFEKIREAASNRAGRDAPRVWRWE